MNFSKVAEKAVNGNRKTAEWKDMDEYYIPRGLEKRVEKALRAAYASGYATAKKDVNSLLTVAPGTWESSYLEILKAKVIKFKPSPTGARGAKKK